MEGSKIFFSYSHSDEVFVLNLHEDLRRERFNVWLDRVNIRKGKNWDDEVELALNDSECMLAILSPSSVVSEHFKDEISRALNTNKIIIPILLSACDIPLRLERKQYIDFTGDYTKALKELLGFLKDPNNNIKRNTEEIKKEPDESKTAKLFPKQKKQEPEDFGLKPEAIKTDSFFQKYKYYLIGIGAVIVILIIYFSSINNNTPSYDAGKAKEEKLDESVKSKEDAGNSDKSIAGATIRGKILYGGYASNPIGVVTNYSKAPAVLELNETGSKANTPFRFTYNNQTGEYSASGLAPGKYAPSVRVEAGYPFDRMSAGDYISFLSGLNEEILINPNDKEVNVDLKVIPSIHLKRPVDNQVLRTNAGDEPEVIHRKKVGTGGVVFEWEAIPEAVRYEVRIILMDGKTRVNQFPFTTSQTSISPDLVNNSGNTYYMFTVDAYTVNNTLIGDFTNFYKNGYGGWFEFKIL